MTYNDVTIPEGYLKDKNLVCRSIHERKSLIWKDQTNEEAPVTGLPPIYFSTCGSFLFSETWDTFAWVSAITDPSAPLSGRAVLDSFRPHALPAPGG